MQTDWVLPRIVIVIDLVVHEGVYLTDSTISDCRGKCAGEGGPRR